MSPTPTCCRSGRADPRASEVHTRGRLSIVMRVCCPMKAYVFDVSHRVWNFHGAAWSLQVVASAEWASAASLRPESVGLHGAR